MNKKRIALMLSATLLLSGFTTASKKFVQAYGQTQQERVIPDKLGLVSASNFKTLQTTIDNKEGKTQLKFPDLNLSEIKSVTVEGNGFEHAPFKEREKIDKKVSNGIRGNWSDGALILNTELTVPGIYTGVVNITYNDDRPA